MQSNLLKIKKTIEQMLETMDFPGEVTIEESGAGLVNAKINSPAANYLIGQGGENLKALQQIARIIISRQEGGVIHLLLDVNNYQQGRLQQIKEGALSLAREVIVLGQPRWLEPMNAYERRIVHMTLADQKNVKTESEGEGEERRIIIKPVNN